jgi:hypothetical protein
MGGNTSYSGRPETFQNDPLGTFTQARFPRGWSDAGQVSPDSIAPNPSGVVIQTSDAFGHTTNAFAPFPAVAIGQGIYRPIELSSFYKTQADVRVDQFSQIDPSILVEDPNNPGFLLCGCPVGTENLADWPMQVTFSILDGKTDPGDAPIAGLIASSETQTWHLVSATQNIIADDDLGIHIDLGKWYQAETDFDVANGVLHGVVTDIASGAVLADKMVFLYDPKYGNYDPKVDGAFNSEAYVEGEHSLVPSADPSLTRPNLAVIDNIDSPGHGNLSAYGQGQDQGGNPWDGILCDHG